MVKVEVIKDMSTKRILRCREGNRIWYQLWISPYLMGYIEMHFKKYIDDGVIKAGWLRNLQQYYVFFYEKKGGKVRGVFGKGNTIKLLGGII